MRCNYWLRLLWTLQNCGVALLFCSPTCCAQQKVAHGDKSTEVRTVTSTDQTEYKRLVLSLANKNPPPRLIGEKPDQRPVFAKDYDWVEQERVLKVIQMLLDNAEPALSELAENLSDTRYCITFDQDYIVNDTVGDICRIILVENLTTAYRPYIPGGELSAARLYFPDALRDKDKMRAWIREQVSKQRPLYELQIEMCQWAINEIPGLPEVSDAEKQTAIRNIQAQIETLRMTRKPVLVKSINKRDIRVPFNRESAENSRPPQE
jgi:hypothetical protein